MTSVRTGVLEQKRLSASSYWIKKYSSHTSMVFWVRETDERRRTASGQEMDSVAAFLCNEDP